MVYRKAQIAKRRREELKIIRRGGLEKLAESYRADSRLLKMVHGLGRYKAKSINAAVSECTNNESNQTIRYYKALGRLMDVQATIPCVRRRVPKEFNTPEKARNALRKLGEKSGFPPYLSKALEHNALEMYFAFRCLGIDGLAESESKWNRYTVVWGRVEHFLADEFLEDNTGLGSATRIDWDCGSARGVEEWFFTYVDKGGMPSAKQARDVPGLSRVVREYGGYDKLKKEWGAFFRKQRSKLKEEDVVRIKAYTARVPRRFLYNASIKDLRAMTGLSKKGASGKRTNKFLPFVDVEPCDVGKVVRACEAGVPHTLIRRAPLSTLDDLARAYKKYPEEKTMLNLMFSPANFKEVYSKDMSKMEGLLRALVRPQSLPKDDINMWRVRAYRAGVPGKYIFNTSIKDLKDIAELYEGADAKSMYSINKLFADVKPSDAGKVVRACKAGVHSTIIRRAPLSTLDDLTKLYNEHPEDRGVYMSMFPKTKFSDVYSEDMSKMEGLLRALLRPQSLPTDCVHRLRARAYRARVPVRFLFDTSTRDLKDMVRLHESNNTLRGKSMFADVKPSDAGKVVRACDAGVPYTLIKRAPLPTLDDLAKLYNEHPEDRRVFRSMFSKTKFSDVYSEDMSKLEGLIQAFLRPQSLPKDDINMLRIRAHRLKVPTRFLFETDIKDLRDMVELFKHIDSNTRSILKGAFANVEPCDAGKVIQTCKAGIPFNIVRIIHQS